MEKITRYKLTCPSCHQEGILVEKERTEIPDVIASGDCSDDMTVYYYEFKIESGNFLVIHRDPHQFAHKTICKNCKTEAEEKKR